MSHENEFHHMAVENLATRCAQETDLYYNSKEFDSRYCFELFRRAIKNKDGQAWEILIVQYQPLVTRWVEKWMSKYPDFSLFNEESQDFVAQAFERFWVSYTPAKFENAQNSLPAVLKYLQMCVHGALTDGWRKLRRLQIEEDVRGEGQELTETDPTPEDRLQSEEFWQFIQKKAKDLKEYKVVYASFYMDLSPREILAEFLNEFKDIKEIYQYKANFIERLGRDDEFKEFFRR
jgi:RNA polymerase sigma factor (sigma-70 family)